MSTKTHLRIYTFEETSLCNKIAGYAALFNGGKPQYGIKGLEIIAQSDMLQYPSINEGVSITAFPNSLTIDRTNSVGETKCIMAIELVEHLEPFKMGDDE